MTNAEIFYNKNPAHHHPSVFNEYFYKDKVVKPISIIWKKNSATLLKLVTVFGNYEKPKTEIYI